MKYELPQGIGWVQLIGMLGSDQRVVEAARVSFAGESKGAEADKKLLLWLYKAGHHSCWEHVVFTIRFKLPVMAIWHLVRHRTMSFNLQSGRYTPFEANDFLNYEVWRKQSTDNKQGSDGVLETKDAALLSMLLKGHQGRSYDLYKLALSKGVAKEQARVFLPAWGSFYTGYITVDARNLMGFLKLRMDSHAQYEIRMFADAIHEHIFTPTLEWTAEAFNGE